MEVGLALRLCYFFLRFMWDKVVYIICLWMVAIPTAQHVQATINTGNCKPVI